MLTNEQLKIMARVADENGIEYAALRAFCEVEAGNQIFATVKGKQVPLIRWEGHYFDRLIKASLRSLARKRGLASPKAGGVKNPKSQEDRYALLNRAKELDVSAAISSTSYGFGQVMGDHWRLFGLKSASHFESLAMSGFEGQLKLVVLFLVKKGVVRYLKLRDWAAVARIYNGPAYAKNGYDVKLAKAYAKYSKATVVHAPNVTVSSAGTLRPGSRGPEVREVQTLLKRAGYAISVDGDYGTATAEAVMDFQQKRGLPDDGIAGPVTMTALYEYRSSPQEKLAVPTPASETEEVKKATPGIVSTVGVVVLKDELATAAEKIVAVNTETAITIGNYLAAGAAIVGVGLAAYAIYGMLKARKTVRGIEDRVPEINAEYRAAKG